MQRATATGLGAKGLALVVAAAGVHACAAEAPSEAPSGGAATSHVEQALDELRPHGGRRGSAAALPIGAREGDGDGGEPDGGAGSHAARPDVEQRPPKKHHTHRRRHRGHHPPRSCGGGCEGGLSFTAIASSSGDFTIAPLAVALNDEGLVAFSGADSGGVERLLLGSGGALTALDVSLWGLERVGRLALDGEGALAFIAATATSGSFFGAFATDTDGSGPTVLYAPEAGGGLADDGALEASSRIAIAANGTVAFSSIQDGHGALYRGPVSGSLAVVRTGTGAFYNNQELDVNAAGTVAMQMEHGACGLQRGVLLFDDPEPDIDDVFKAIAGVSVGQQPDTALNDSGLVAFALTGTAPDVDVLRCPEGEDPEHLNVALGVYTAHPTPLSDPPALSLVADSTGAFASFGAVDINDAGTVVFEADLDGGGRGIYRGPDPVGDRIVAVGDELGGEVVTDIQLGQLNDECELAFAAVTASGRSVWRASGVAPGGSSR